MTHDDVLEAMARAFAENSPCEMTKAEAMAATWAAIRALPPGWVVVPREPTPHMVNRGLERADINWREASEDEALSDDEARRIYRAMIAAALPVAPQEERDDAR